ncbi:Do family serine endopeptidase [Gellertiella hungarica]|uniref:Probable periplasmic serine endoprotease DegP-like n=1 Tax=Gellertiella hungarica TaxID=1572859 RepID=A0A7W6J2J0_9HYPH|nr:Do family serine endopeptidase [Gellertiella hungarica]MBB4063596.1 serine protease Do [Gellertiella hungarica]
MTARLFPSIRRLLATVSCAVLSLSVAATGAPSAARAASAAAIAATPAGPKSVADLAEGLLDAVVNISTSQNVKDDEGAPAPQVQEGAPFQDLFDDYYKGEGKDSRSHTVSSLGSGFVIDPAGYIVTNNHVIEGADDIEVIFPKGNKLKAKLIGTDVKTDLSLLKVESKVPLKAVSFGDSRKIRIGDWVMAIGNPFGLGGSVSIGIVSARGRNINAGPYDNFIQTDAAINKGNSGGPLFNMYGEVIGINTAIISPSGGSIGIGFSVPSEIASTVIDQLKQYGETRRGWLGVRVQPVTEDIAASLGLDKIAGALVSGIVKGGPVENGPIRTGDIIMTFDGKPVAEMRDLLRLVAESPTGKEVAVELIRDGKPLTVTVKLGRLDDKADPATPSDPGESLPDGGQGEDGDIMQPDEQPMPAPQEEMQPLPELKDGASGEGATDGEEIAGDVLGMILGPLDEAARKEFGIAKTVNGVVVEDVVEGSAAAGKGIVRGDTLVEVAQTAVKGAGTVAEKIAELKREGRRNALLLVASPNGDLRTVALAIE